MVSGSGSQNIIAIIQARMGSSRLPGKVLQPIEGRPMLWHIINRLKTCNRLNNIVVATTISRDDDVIENFCHENDVDFFRGSEHDVLDRYYQTAKEFGADIIVRITADCAVIDPKVTDHVISSYLENQNSCDFCSNVLTRTYPNGLETEVIPFETLETVWHQAEEPRHREHVTLYLADHLDDFRLMNVRNPEDLSYLRWTVDQQEDLDLIRRFYQHLYPNKQIFHTEDILDVLSREPFLMEINKEVQQKVS